MIEIVARAKCGCGRVGPEVTAEISPATDFPMPVFLRARAYLLAAKEGWHRLGKSVTCPTCLGKPKSTPATPTKTHPVPPHPDFEESPPQIP